MRLSIGKHSHNLRHLAVDFLFI